MKINYRAGTYDIVFTNNKKISTRLNSAEAKTLLTLKIMNLLEIKSIGLSTYSF